MSYQIIVSGSNRAELTANLQALASEFGVATLAAPTPQAPPVQQSTYQQPPVNQGYQQPPTAPVYPPVQQQPTPAAYPPVQQPVQQPYYGQQQPGYPQQQQQSYGQQTHGAVPTAAAPTYTLDQLGVAAQPVMDAGRQQDLVNWINQHGAGALTQLDPKLYGEFATFLRSLGAKI
ncbi:MAG: hypothetical protein K6T85_03110 [Gorillibacterium sp.]|nr:hypothetical protein [Gorillibacterium sp.]